MLAVVLVQRIGVGLAASRFWLSLLDVINSSDGNLSSPRTEMSVVCLVDVFVTNFFM
jgi:hypothetical protein